MPALAGIVLALLVALFARAGGFDRERSFYPVVLVVVASYYDLFAVMGGNSSELLAELIGFAVFAAAAVLGFRFNLWIVAGALAGHGVFDFFHSSLLPGRGVPSFWPMFCMMYDVVAAGTLAALIVSGKLGASRAIRNPDSVQ